MGNGKGYQKGTIDSTFVYLFHLLEPLFVPPPAKTVPYVKVSKQRQITLVIFQSDVAKIEETLKAWCESCDGMLACLEDQVNRANAMKQTNITHQKQIEQKVNFNTR